MLERPIDRGSGRDDPDGELGLAHAIGTDERRMHVRAYNHWVSLLAGRPFPSSDDIDPGSSADFGPHSVLLDFRDGIEEPAIAFIGDLLRQECELDTTIRTVADVPARSLLSRLTDHYLQIIANRAPIGFEAEFVGTRATTMLYRGILMPFSSDGEAIDFIYGVINWKELLDEVGTHELRLEMQQALARDAAGPAWADGPSHMDEPAVPVTRDTAEPPTGLADRLALARDEAEQARSADARGRDALYRAIGRAYDVALAAEEEPDDYTDLLLDSGIKALARAPMTPIAKLVFGSDYDKTRLAEVAAVLTHARSSRVPLSGARDWIASHEGGIKGIVAAAREARRPKPVGDRLSAVRDRLREAAPKALVTLPGTDEFVVLVARRIDDRQVALVDHLTHAAAVEHALRALAR